MERRKHYDKKYKLPGKQGKKENIINSAAFAVNVDTLGAIENIFFLRNCSLEKRGNMYETIINNSKLKVEKGKRVPQTETGLEVLEPLHLRGLSP